LSFRESCDILTPDKYITGQRAGLSRTGGGMG
jgi:hypothetical protein